MKTVIISIFGGLLLFGASLAWSSDSNSGDSVLTTSPAKIDLFLDCPFCDFNYFCTEITFVNFVRYREEAEVHLLITSQQTGAGGVEYTLEFIGQNECRNMRDTLTYIALESDTRDNTRAGLVSVVKMGLMRYAARSAAARNIKIQYSQPTEAKEVADKWNYWVFSLSLEGWLDGQKSYRDMSLSWEAEAQRTTRANKFQFDLYGSYEEDKSYDYYVYTSISRSWGGEVWYVRALDADHWAAGAGTELFSSRYSNIRLQSRSTLALEYDFFPYSQSTRRQLRLTYEFSNSYIDYQEKTILEKYHDWLAREKLSISLQYIQPWGSASAGLYASHYFPDFDKNRLSVDSYLSMRVAQGLSFYVNANASRIRDQHSLAMGDASSEEVILKRRELATSYDYAATLGVTYSFGSIYNNIVNPRFGD